MLHFWKSVTETRGTSLGQEALLFGSQDLVVMKGQINITRQTRNQDMHL